jgi:hypothetical protein
MTYRSRPEFTAGLVQVTQPDHDQSLRRRLATLANEFENYRLPLTSPRLAQNPALLALAHVDS